MLIKDYSQHVISFEAQLRRVYSRPSVLVDDSHTLTPLQCQLHATYARDVQLNCTTRPAIVRYLPRYMALAS